MTNHPEHPQHACGTPFNKLMKQACYLIFAGLMAAALATAAYEREPENEKGADLSASAPSNSNVL